MQGDVHHVALARDGAGKAQLIEHAQRPPMRMLGLSSALEFVIEGVAIVPPCACPARRCRPGTWFKKAQRRSWSRPGWRW
jgi:hypothetical protein